MSYSEDQLWELLRQSYDMPYGAAQIALLERVVVHADALHAKELAFDARMRATTAYVYGGESAKSFVTFSWCRAEFDRNPVTYAPSQHLLLWHFKYMIAGLTKFPEVPLDRTQGVLDEMEQRWRDAGHSPHAVYAKRHHVAAHLGDLDQADEWYARWCAAPRDDLSDCVGCDPSGKAAFLASRGRDEEAVALAEPVLAGRLTCSEQPQGILTSLLKPYLRTGRLEQARDAHRRAYRLHRPNLADLADVADHVEFCALTGNEARGVEILQRHLGWLDHPPSPWAAMRFAAASALLLRLAREAGHSPLLLRRPGYQDRPAGDVRPAALVAELAEFSLAAAARFDARNGTGHQSAQIQEMLDATPLVESLPLSPTAARPSSTASRIPVAGGSTSKRAADSVSQVDLETIAAQANVDALLDLAEDHLRRGRLPQAFAAWHAFDERFARVELTPLQRGRRADGHGVEAANSDALAEAETAWRSAVDLFGQAGDEVRRQATRGRIGRVMCAGDRGEEGLSLVEEAASYLLAHANRDRWTGALTAVGTAQLYVGRPDEAMAALERATDYLPSCLDPRGAAHIAVLRAQCLGSLGRMEEAREAAIEAARISREGAFNDGIAHAEMMAGFAAEQLGDGDAAAASYDEAIAAATDAELIRRVRAQRAGLLAGTPRAAEVVDDLVEAVAARTASGDSGGAARARHSLAIAYLNSGRPLDCAEVGEEALAWFVARAASASDAAAEAGGSVEADVKDVDDPGDEYDPSMLLEVRHLLSVAYQSLGQPEEAITQLELISVACAEQGNPAGVGQMAEEIGDILDRQDRDAAAALRYLAAAEAFRAAGHTVEEFRNRRQHATSLLWSEDVEAALEALAAVDAMSLNLPEGEHAAWERAMLLMEGAKVLRNAERLPEATLRAGFAAAAFRTSGFVAQAAHAELLHAELLLRDGRAHDAALAARRGLAELPEDEDGRARLDAVLAAALEADSAGKRSFRSELDTGLG
jgi:tetratricopeptide (TPR) repeat protein